MKLLAYEQEERDKLLSIESGAQVNDVETILNTDTSTIPMQFVLDENDLGSDSNIKVPTQSSVKKYVDDMVGANIILKDGYNADTNTPNLDIPPTGVMLGWMYIVTVAGTFFSKTLDVGDALIAHIDDPQIETDWIILQRNLDAVTIKVLYESNDDTNVFTNAEQTKVSNLTGTNSGDITLNSSDTTQETLDLTSQELTVNVVTQTTDGAMIGEDKLKLDNISSSGNGDGWVSGLDVTENSPKDQKVIYQNGTYLINGILKTILTGGVYDLENGYLSVDHYAGMTSYQHKFVDIYVDDDEVIKSLAGPAADKNDIPDVPILPNDTVCMVVIEIKVDNGANPKDIENKVIEDCRKEHIGTDEFVKVSADDTNTGHLFDKLSNTGNVTFAIENVGGNETIKADALVSGDLKVYYAEDLTFTETTSSSYIEKMNLTKAFETGVYLIDVMYDWDIDQDNTDFYSEVTLDTIIINEEHIQEIKEKGRTQRIPTLRRFKQTLSGTQVIAINLKSGDGTAKARMINASITVTKINIQ